MTVSAECAYGTSMTNTTGIGFAQTATMNIALILPDITIAVRNLRKGKRDEKKKESQYFTPGSVLPDLFQLYSRRRGRPYLQ